MNTKEAIERIKARFDKWALDDKDMEAIQTLIPEFREFEDEGERIRRKMIKHFKAKTKDKWCNMPVKDIIAWLEKQKDLDKMIVVSPEVWDNAISDAFENGKKEGEKQKENLKSSDSIPPDCTSDAKCEDRWHKVSDSLPDNPREVLCKDEAGNYFIGRYYTGEGWEISNYDDEDKPHHLNPPVSKWIDFPSEKQKEQKPVDYEHEMWKNCVANFEGGKKEVIEHPEKYGLQKPIEWSEENKEKIVTISEIIEHCTTIPYSGGTLTLNKEYKKELLCFIRSLRPSWKPSKEQMDALRITLDYMPDTFKPRCTLMTLQNDLKKQM